MSVFLTTSIGCLAFASGAAESIANLPVPTPQQVASREAGVGLFFHWPPSFYQGSDGDNLPVLEHG